MIKEIKELIKILKESKPARRLKRLNNNILIDIKKIFNNLLII
jgi:hypothetical protein